MELHFIKPISEKKTEDHNNQKCDKTYTVFVEKLTKSVTKTSTDAVLKGRFVAFHCRMSIGSFLTKH